MCIMRYYTIKPFDVVNIYFIDPMKIFRDEPKSEVDTPFKNMQNHVWIKVSTSVFFYTISFYLNSYLFTIISYNLIYE